MAERHTRGTSRGNAGGRALGSLHTAHLGPRSAHCGQAASGSARRRLDLWDWFGTSDSLLGRILRTAKRVDAWHGTYLCLAELLAGNLHTVDRHNSDTRCLVSPSLCTGLPHCGQTLPVLVAAQAGHSHTGLCLAWYGPIVWPIHFLATCTWWIGAALTPRAGRCRWFQRCAALWADFGGRCLQVGCLPPTFATNAVVGFGVVLAQVGHTDEVPTRAALPGFCFALVRLLQLALHAAGSS